MIQIAIVAVAYNRPKSLLRLLSSLKNADYLKYNVDLVISIDKSNVERDILQIAEEFEWSYGEKIIKTFEKRQGLRKHILHCGDITQNYDAVIVFEDDIVASPYYFNYTVQTLKYFKSDTSIAGISLYSPNRNEMVEKSFIPVKGKSDVYIIQSAQSWGQCWTKEMWRDFREWYKDNSKELIVENDMPVRIYSWPESSWKKYFMKYLVETDKYFIYPYESYSTNAADIGQHVKTSNSQYQVPLSLENKEYIFSPSDSLIRYDVFFERINLAKYLKLGILDNQLCVDIYGSKLINFSRQYILTRKILPYKKIASYALHFKPQEVNIVFLIAGNDIFLYDLEIPEKEVNLKGKVNKNRELEYFTSLNWRDSLFYGVNGFIRAIKKRI